MTACTLVSRHGRFMLLLMIVAILFPALAVPAIAQNTERRDDRDRINWRIVEKASKGRLWVIGREPRKKLKTARIKRVYMRNAKKMLRTMVDGRGRGASAAGIYGNCPGGYERSAAFTDTETQVYHPFRVPGPQDYVQVFFGSEAYWNENAVGKVTDSTVCGLSFASWVGSNPYDADSIQINNAWTQEGAEVSFSASIPGGVGINVSGSEKNASLPMDCGRGSYCQSDYSGFSWRGDLTELSQSAAGVFKFPGTSKTVVANGDVRLG